MHTNPESIEKLHYFKSHSTTLPNKYEFCLNWTIFFLIFSHCPGNIASEGMTEEEINELIQSRIIFIGRSEFQCAECGHIASIKPNIWKHIEAKHMAPRPVSCQFCGKICPSKNARQSHISRYHRANKHL